MQPSEENALPDTSPTGLARSRTNTGPEPPQPVGSQPIAHSQTQYQLGSALSSQKAQQMNANTAGGGTGVQGPWVETQSEALGNFVRQQGIRRTAPAHSFVRPGPTPPGARTNGATPTPGSGGEQTGSPFGMPRSISLRKPPASSRPPFELNNRPVGSPGSPLNAFGAVHAALPHIDDDSSAPQLLDTSHPSRMEDHVTFAVRGSTRGSQRSQSTVPPFQSPGQPSPTPNAGGARKPSFLGSGAGTDLTTALVHSPPTPQSSAFPVPISSAQAPDERPSRMSSVTPAFRQSADEAQAGASTPLNTRTSMQFTPSRQNSRASTSIIDPPCIFIYSLLFTARYVQ